jgi:hypothetical protein
MFYLAILSDLARLEPLLDQSGRWMTHDFEWIVLGVAGAMALVLVCSIVAAGLALLCSFAVLLRSLFGTLMFSQRLPRQFMLEPANQSQVQSYAAVNLPTLGVKESRWAK